MATSISGVTRVAGVPAQALVTLINSTAGTIISSMLSDVSTGVWSFTGLTAGTYEVLCVKDGYKPLMNGPWVLNGFGDFNYEVLADNPTWYCRHNESSGTIAINEVVGGPNGTYFGTPVFGAAAIYTGGLTCWDLNNASYAVIPSTVLPLPGSAFTLEILLKRKATITGLQQLIDRDPGATDRKWQWRFESGANSNFIKVAGTTQNQSATGVANANDVVVIAVTVDATGVVKQYKNGVEVASSTFTAVDYGSNTNGINIGRRISGDNQANYFCAETVVYPAALSAARLLAHAQAANLA